jgi:Protein of unknown function (DUF4235)
MWLLRLMFKPFAILAGMIGGRIGRSVYKSVWDKIDGGPRPNPSSGEGGPVKVVGARALEGAIMAGTAAAVDRAFAAAYHYLIGVWPKKPHEPDEQADA